MFFTLFIFILFKDNVNSYDNYYANYDKIVFQNEIKQIQLSTKVFLI